MADSFIQVAPNSTGDKVDNSQLTQNGGTVVQRQRVTNGDPVNVNNLQRTDSNGNSYTREAVPISETDASMTVGTTPEVAITAGAAVLWVDIENVSTNGNLLGFTFDGTTPGFTAGAPNAGTFVLTPWGTKTYDKRIPAANLTIVGSAAGTVATIKYA
jgi:hypothetical protein